MVHQAEVVEEKKRALSENHMPEATGQLYSIHPTQIELYSLQLLVNHVKGPQCYKDILSFMGVSHDSFNDTAIALGLAKDDNI